MATPPISYGVSMNTLKSKILNPAQTSIYSVIIESPSSLKQKGDTDQTFSEYLQSEFQIRYDSELIELTCIEANLPGSSLGTIETVDYMGTTEKHAYRRLYDDTIDFTFLITQDSNYHQIRFFDAWMRYIVRESGSALSKNSYYTRVRYPKQYQSRIRISKFEKNFGANDPQDSEIPFLTYNFVGAYPKSISSIPVSYEASDLLKVSVSFTYTRYYIDRETTKDRLLQEQRDFERNIDPSTSKGNIPGTRTFGTIGNGTFAELNQINFDIG